MIVTKDRRYELHAASDDERKLWLLDLELIIKENVGEDTTKNEDAKDLY